MAESGDGPEFIRPRVVHAAPIHLADYDERWPQWYADVESRIRAVLGRSAVDVQHVGSTSIPGLAAKPIIDVLLLVADPADEAAYVPALESAGFVLHVREPAWHQHRFLKGSDPDVNLHVFADGSAEARRMTTFRDHLRGDPADRDLYLATKRRLAGRTWELVQDYADAKSEVVEDILTRAG